MQALTQLSRYGSALRPFGLRALVRLAGLLFATQSSSAASLLHDHDLRRSAVAVGQLRTEGGNSMEGVLSVADGLRDAGNFHDALRQYYVLLQAIEKV